VTKHYRSRRGGGAGFSAEEQTVVEDLARIAEKMDRRLQTLEKIIDADHPGWKERI
jgi:phage shock protein B